MSAQENKALIQQIFDELSRGNPALWLQKMSDDVVFSIIGTTKFSGTFRGKQELLDKAMGPMQQLVEPGSATTQIEELIADGDRVVMLANGHAKLRSGAEHNNVYAMVFRVQNGMIVEVKEYIDTAPVDRLFGPRTNTETH